MTGFVPPTTVNSNSSRPAMTPLSDRPPALNVGRNPSAARMPQAQAPRTIPTQMTANASGSNVGSPVGQELTSNSNGLKRLGTVDSGIGGAMAAMRLDGEVKHLAAQTCLPIGDKAPNALISFTAQMVAEGLIGQQLDDVIVACNTASTAKKECCEIVTQFILGQADPAKSIYEEGSPEQARIGELLSEINSAATYDGKVAVIESKVHGVVGPTANSAVSKAFNALTEGGKNEFVVIVDSTKATAAGGLYPEKILEGLEAKLGANGYTKDSHSTVKDDVDTDPGLKEPQKTLVDIHAMKFTKEGENDKTVIVQGRGHPAWVPEIEGNRLGENNLRGEKTDIALAFAAKEASQSVEFDATVADAARLNDLAHRQPDLMMMCCTHYPALVDGLKQTLGPDPSQTEFLTQDQVVKEMAQEITGKVIGEVSEEDTLKITRGQAQLAPGEGQGVKDILSAVFPDNQRGVEVGAMGAERFESYENAHRREHFIGSQITERDRGIDEGNVKGNDVGSNILHRNDAGVKSFWTQSTDAENRSDRGKVDMRASIKSSLPGETPHRMDKASHSSFVTRANAQENAEIDRLNTASSAAADRARNARDTLQGLGLSDTQIRISHNKIGNIARLATGGETRGLNILASKQEPGLELFSSAVAITDVIQRNNGLEGPNAEKENIAIVTGFTVVNPQGGKVGGENDGPPGAVSMAKVIVDNGTPVSLVCDEHNEASVFSAAKAAGLVLVDRNAGDTAASDKTFAGSTLAPGLTVEVFNHDADATEDERAVELAQNEARVRDSLADKNTGLMISIERPSPSAAGNMSSMIGADITSYNANLGNLFENPTVGKEGARVTTIGIGDGGNEIGTGRVAPDTSSMRKPNYDPVVNNGDKIAAKVETDHMVLASVSNNGGVAMSLSVNTLLKGFSAENPSARSIVETYKSTIDGMFNEGMSIDGVTKENAQTVDGRTLHRAEGDEPAQMGTDAATHDDMFDEMVRIADRY